MNYDIHKVSRWYKFMLRNEVEHTGRVVHVRTLSCTESAVYNLYPTGLSCASHWRDQHVFVRCCCLLARVADYWGTCKMQQCLLEQQLDGVPTCALLSPGD